MPSSADDLEALKERAWRQVTAIDAALERGDIDEQGWHRCVADIVVPAYLSAETAWGGSGKTGDAANWEHSRRPVAAAIDRSGSFLDVGCANGYLMESVRRWAAEDGHVIEPYGLEIAPELAELARSRLRRGVDLATPPIRSTGSARAPSAPTGRHADADCYATLADRIWVGNARNWKPPRTFDFVRTGLDYAPPRRRRRLVEHLLQHAVAPGGRLVIGVFNEEVERRSTEELVASWGHEIAGRVEAPHRDPRIVYRAFWLDR